MVILDTSVIIDHLRLKSGDSILIKLVKNKPTEKFGIAMISIQELYEGKSTRERTREKDLLAVLAGLKILPYTYEVAKQAGIIAREDKLDIGLGDAAVAATCMVNKCPLVTLNKSDFAGIEGLELEN